MKTCGWPVEVKESTSRLRPWRRNALGVKTVAHLSAPGFLSYTDSGTPTATKVHPVIWGNFERVESRGLALWPVSECWEIRSGHLNLTMLHTLIDVRNPRWKGPERRIVDYSSWISNETYQREEVLVATYSIVSVERGVSYVPTEMINKGLTGEIWLAPVRDCRRGQSATS
jgi:hypothetical protein